MGILSYFKRSRYRPLVVLFDEGPVHSAHNILVDANFDVEIVEVEKFFKLTPFADMTVIQSATESTLIKRLYKRGDWSPRVCDEEELNRFIGNAAKLYKILSKKLLRSTDKALVIDSTSLKPSEFVEQLFPFIEGTKNK